MPNVCLDCAGAIGLHVHLVRKESKNVAKVVVFLTVLETRSQHGGGGLQGVSKGCQRDAPGYPKGAPAVPNVAKRGAKDVEMDAFGYVMWSQGPSQAPSKLQVPNLIQKGIKMDGQNMLSLAFTRDL